MTIKQVYPLNKRKAETKMVECFLDKCPFDSIEGFVKVNIEE